MFLIGKCSPGRKIIRLRFVGAVIASASEAEDLGSKATCFFLENLAMLSRVADRLAFYVLYCGKINALAAKYFNNEHRGTVSASYVVSCVGWLCSFRLLCCRPPWYRVHQLCAVVCLAEDVATHSVPLGLFHFD
jgi:uncharacterized membrane protein YbaN (DUF454 family)